jgi:hypothetical protein
MTRLFILLFTSLNFTTACNRPTETVEIKEKRNSNYQYKDFIIADDKIWALTTNGKIIVFDANSGEPINNNVNNDSQILILTKDKEGNIIIADKNNWIKKLNKDTNAWVTISKYSNTLLGITFNSKNNLYQITNKGIFDATSKKYYYSDSSQNSQIRHVGGWFREPVYLMDKNDNIWIGFGYGEWGGELFIFNTIDKKFITPNLNEFPITLNPIKSIFESNNNVYVTSGLMHFSTSGSIAKFDSFKSKLVFESEEHKKLPDDSTNTEIVDGEYIGPGAFNSGDNCIYFYSQNGIFKGNPNTNLTQIENWKNVFKPKLHWSNGQPDAVGSPMNVLKLQFLASNKLIFLSENDGIGIYDGKTLAMTQ